MSAVNIIPTSTGVSIFTDAATYSPEGILSKLSDKCHVTKNSRLAVCGRGNEGFAKLIANLLSDLDWSIDEVRQDDGALIDRAYMKVQKKLLEHAGKALNEIYIVGFSDEDGGVRTMSWSTMTEPRFVAGNSGTAWIAPLLNPRQIGIAKANASTDGGWDVGRFGLSVIEQQRADKGDPLLSGGNRHSVGGHVLRTDVSESGIVQRVVHRWPEDRVGHAIQPNAPTISRQQRRRMERLAA